MLDPVALTLPIIHNQEIVLKADTLGVRKTPSLEYSSSLLLQAISSNLPVYWTFCSLWGTQYKVNTHVLFTQPLNQAAFWPFPMFKRQIWDQALILATTGLGRFCIFKMGASGLISSGSHFGNICGQLESNVTNVWHFTECKIDPADFNF
jgi:hypothetical protein